MPILPDPRALDAFATRLHQQAEELRRRARLIATATDTTRWTSPAASVFRARSLTLGSALRRCAVQVDDAGEALRAHANAVRARIAEIEAGARAELSLAAATARTAKDAADKVMGTVSASLVAAAESLCSLVDG